MRDGPLPSREDTWNGSDSGKSLTLHIFVRGTGVAIQEGERVERSPVSWEGGSMQKAIIGTAVGVLGLGGLLLASSGRTTTNSATTPTVGSERVGSTVVDCGEGRQALVH